MIYAGFSGVLWQALYRGLGYYREQLTAATTASGTANAPSVGDIAQLSEVMFTSLINGAEAINANSTAAAWQAELVGLQEIAALPVTFTPSATVTLTNRISAYSAGLAALAPLVPEAPYGIPTVMTSGVPIIPKTGLLDFYSTFAFETIPSGLTSNNLLTFAQGVADDFQSVANTISAFQGTHITQLYDVAVRESMVAQSAANIIGALTAGSLAQNVAGMNTWNQIVTLPAMTMCADLLNNSPAIEESQQEAVLRNLMLSTATKIGVFLLTQRQPLLAQIKLATLLVGETLMDVAARALGNFEQWTDIATLNGLFPPYVGAVSSPGIAGWGTKLILPTPGVNVSAVGTPPSYTINFLGVDLYIGPINGVMPAWTGDFEIITGYANLAWALGRRLQTVQGSLIYHSLYGSRIPPEVGAVQSAQTAGHVAAFGKSAILSDPRVQRVLSATALLQPNSKIAFAASVQPGGFQTTPLQLNEVISALPQR